MSTKRIIYFAHPVTIYNTPKEKCIRRHIKKQFPGFCILNPNSKTNEKNYKKEGMEYFLKLVDKCEILVIYPFEDNTLGSGIVKEALRAYHSGKKIYQINPINWEIKKIPGLKNCLTVNETVKKIKDLRKYS